MACAQICRKNRQVIKLETEKDVSVALAQYIADLSESHITTKCSFSVVLSGGTLVHTLRKLVESYKDSVDWSKWYVFWVDERKCSFQSEFSNYKLANDGFLSKNASFNLLESLTIQKTKKKGVLESPYLLELQKVPIPEQNIFPMYFHKYPECMAENYQVRLKTLVHKRKIPLSASGCPIFDLMLLGIGPDGHIASLYPDRPERYEKKRWVTCVYSPSQPPPLLRTTLTFPVIKSALNIAMVVTGKGVADAVYKTFGPGGEHWPPIPCAELHAEAEGEVTWYLDKDAASKI